MQDELPALASFFGVIQGGPRHQLKWGEITPVSYVVKAI